METITKTQNSKNRPIWRGDKTPKSVSRWAITKNKDGNFKLDTRPIKGKRFHCHECETPIPLNAEFIHIVFEDGGADDSFVRIRCPECGEKGIVLSDAETTSLTIEVIAA